LDWSGTIRARLVERGTSHQSKKMTIKKVLTEIFNFTLKDYELWRDTFSPVVI
jgi:hypothetical protein